ncbi:hypothetical protein [Lacrimispora brassicae]
MSNIDCLFSSIATVVKSWNCEAVEIIGAGAWWFGFSKPISEKTDSIWGRVHAYRYDSWRILEAFSGIKVTWNDTTEIEEILPILQVEVAAQRPIIIYINSHFCPWHPHQKEYYTHFCLVIGMDQENQDLICNDANPPKYKERLPFKLFAQGCGPCITFAKVDKPDKGTDWREVIQDVIDRLGISTELYSFNLMRRFSEELYQEINNCHDRLPAWIEDTVPVVLNVGLLQKGRIYFARTLTYFAEQFGILEFVSLANRILQASQQWNTISFFAVKSRLNPNDRHSLLRIPQKILEIADFEEQITFDLISLVNKYS